MPSELKHRNHRTNWIRGLQKLGLAPIMEPLEESSSAEDMFHNEEFWIASLLAAGADLVNSDKGGRGRFGARSDQERAALALINKGRKASAETRQKLSEAQKKRYAEHPEVRGGWGKPIVHLDTGITYPTVLDCMEAIGLNGRRNAVYDVANGKYSHHRGQHFAWA